ncbi:MAG: family 43 glycosylhydrolase, partial [Acidimicrobiales bacterium]
LVATGLVLALVAALTGVVVTERRLDSTRQRLARTETALNRSDATLGERAAQLAGTAEDLSTTAAELAGRTAERDQLNQDLATVRYYALTAAGALQAATGVSGAQAAFIQAETTCLQGVQRALTQIAVADHNGALASLTAVSAPCQTASGPPPAPATAAGVPAAPSGPANTAVYPFDFPDPFVLRVGTGYYGFATNSALGNIQMIRSGDLVTWTAVGDALAGIPAWASPNATWAPSVLPVGGHFVLYYTIRRRADGLQCVSRALADTPAGPYVDSSSAPLVCQSDQGGDIDPSPFLGPGGVPFLAFKSQGSAATPNLIWSERLSGDGLSTVGTPAILLGPDRPWEGGVVEAPSMTTIGRRLFLFYSGNQWSSGAYAIGAATCASPQGPCTKAGSAPLLASHGTLAGPGGGEFFTDPSGATFVAFHAYSAPNVGAPNPRLLHIARVTVTGGVPMLGA